MRRPRRQPANGQARFAPADGPILTFAVRRYDPAAHGQEARNDLVDWLQYIALRLVSMVLHSFPVEANLRTAKFIGTLLYRVDRKHRERALGNLRRSFPEMPERQLPAPGPAEHAAAVHARASRCCSPPG